jgi:hypothetical protein
MCFLQQGKLCVPLAPRRNQGKVRWGPRLGGLAQRGHRHAVFEQAFVWRELSLQFLLPQDRSDGIVHPEHLVVPRQHLARAARPAVVEDDEVLHEVEQPLLREHAVEQPLGIEACLVGLRIALPFDEVLPPAGDRTVARLVAVAHHQEGVVVKSVGDAVFGQVIGEVVVETGAYIPVDGLQLDEHQRQPIHEADQVRAPVVVRHAHALDLQLAHRREAVVRGIAEVDDASPHISGLAGDVTPFHRHPAADEVMEFAVVLEERTREVDPRQLLDGLFPRFFRDFRVEPRERCAQVPHQHDLPLRRAPQRSRRPEGLRVVRVNGFPTEGLVEILGESLLDQAVFAVDVGEGHRLPTIGQSAGSQRTYETRVFYKIPK